MIGNKNKLVCKVFDSEAFDRIEKMQGFKIFFNELARPNLRTLTLLDDVLMVGDQKYTASSGRVYYGVSGNWRDSLKYQYQSATARVSCVVFGYSRMGEIVYTRR